MNMNLKKRFLSSRRQYLEFAIGLVSGFLICYVTFRRSSKQTTTTSYITTTGVYYSNSTLGSTNDDCSIFEEPTCSCNQETWTANDPLIFGTHPSMAPTDWKQGYQDMSTLVGYAQLQ